MRSRVVLKKDLQFTGEIDGHEIPIGATSEETGERDGVSPKTLVLTALAGCTAIDVVGILRKMRLQVDDFSVEAEAETVDQHPKIFRRILVTYRVRGKDLTEEKVDKAVRLSMDKYCGVTAMLVKATRIETKIVIEN